MKFIKLMIGGLLVLISEQLARSFVFINKPLYGICPTFSHLTQSSMLFAENRTVRYSKAKHFFCSIILVCQFSLSNKRLQSLFTIISTSNANIHYNCLIITLIRNRNLSKCMSSIHKKGFCIQYDYRIGPRDKKNNVFLLFLSIISIIVLAVTTNNPS